MHCPSRERELLNTFEDMYCAVCGEVESRYLRWYPHHRKIRSYFMRYGKKTVQRHFAKNLISESDSICQNCIDDKKWDEAKGLWPN
jgi:hypothetical protein